VFSILSIAAYAIPTKVYLNESTQVNIKSSNVFDNYTLTSNLTTDQFINFTFDADANSNGRFEVEFTASNKSGYLFRFRVWDEVESETIEKVDCEDTTQRTTFFSDGVGGIDFNVFNTFNVVFNSSLNKVNISVGGTSLGLMDTCVNVTEVGFVSFIFVQGSADIKNRFVLAENANPVLETSIPNQTWPEDTSTGFNISGNFSDPNNDTLTFTLEAAVENITITVNQNTGIVNLTPDQDFFGIRYVRFTANDSNDFTFSNNVTLNVTNVNDLPNASNAIISNLDDLNMTNGSLTASWSFDDKDNDTITANETLWYINGIENASLRNSTTINSANTTKNENWSFSVRVYDGTGFSDFVYSINLTIDNTLQEFSHTLGTETIERNRLFTYDVNYTDLDNDIITFFDNSTLFNITNEGIINFTPTNAGNITVNITLSQNPNVSGILTIEVEDSSAPEITSISTSNSGTSTVTVTLSVTTDETAICNFATTNINFSSMSQMSSTSSASHSNSQSFTSDTSGTYYVRCNDTIGNVMNSSSSTNFNADIQDTSSSSSSSGGGGGGGWSCRYTVECSQWSECLDGQQTRSCEDVKVLPFYSDTKCEYLLEQEIEMECTVSEFEEGAEKTGETLSEDESGSEAAGPTGAVIFGDLLGKLKPGHAVSALIIIGIIGTLYFTYFRKPPSQLSHEEMRKLYGMMKSEEMKTVDEMVEYSKYLKNK
tara:strand:- start:21402 stop:23543 length:2142 start_codon:yes stop_codon:yes gene_type:complete